MTHSSPPKSIDYGRSTLLSICGTMADVIININNGPEIEEEIRAHIWDGYHKALKENKGKIRSTGLGLTIVKYMLDMHGFSYG